MKYNNFSALINVLILSLVTPLVASYFDLKLIVYLPLMFIFLLSLATLRNNKIYLMPFRFLLLIFLFFIFCIYQQLSGKGIGSGGLIIILIEIILFFQILSFYFNDNFEKKLISTLNIIFIIILFSLYLELVLLLSGFLETLGSIFDSTNVAKYKTYNGVNPLLRILFNRGLNSTILGSQSAGTLALGCMIWFYLFNKIKYKQSNFYRKILLISSVIIFLLTTNQTNSLLFIMLFIFLIIFTNETFFNSLQYKIIATIIVVLFASSEFIIRDIIFYKVKEAKDYEEYLNTFLFIMRDFNDLSFSDKILGYGRFAWNERVETADLGFGAILFRIGVLGFSIIVLIIFFVLSISWKIYYRTAEDYLLSKLLIFNFLMVLMWWASLIHYTPAIEPGGRELFALHIAILLVIIVNYKRYEIKKDLEKSHES